MKKIIPFNNVLQFNTDVREITAISLEHEIKKYPDMISGTFYITGEYKITDGQLDKEKFNFELPFDIALSNNYELDSLLVDIDDFRYDLISDKDLKINIDLYIDGEEIVSPPIEREIYKEELNYEEKIEEPKNIRELTDEILSELVDTENEYFKPEDQIENQEEIQESTTNNDSELIPSSEIIDDIETERIDLLKDMLTDDKENTMNEEININNNENINNNIFEPTEVEEKYVTYRVYKVLDTDTIDSIIAKYNVTKEMLADYNNIENITPGDKLIIPTTNEK